MRTIKRVNLVHFRFLSVESVSVSVQRSIPLFMKDSSGPHEIFYTALSRQYLGRVRR